ncbi:MULTISPECIES: response regulator transcription factor [Pseudomonadota]|jgi:DNA-binding response OmpR family regulator|uniref:response regulator transcription factor n=1 Tax=Pseudomonadota TaxID=1224 RepID=UPI001B446DEF|nr:response regulator transcription factor [Achromobacter xylosoxidans]MBP7655157.1 response regulator transcription factor [Pseudoxanthomonas sp.]MCH4578068.1 response regulator [Achromobacter xylosoxidans]
MTQQKILVVEDDLDSASILEAYLRKDGFVVSTAHDGAAALKLHAQWQPDLVLLDVMLPKISGTDVLAAIRRIGDTPVIMVTAVGDEPEKLGALRYGADDYIVKPYSPKEVVVRVHAVLRRSRPAVRVDGVLRHGSVVVNTSAVQAAVEDSSGQPTLLNLTPAEFNLLAKLLRTPFKAFTRNELMEACMPESDALERAVDVHIHNLRRKLEQLGVTGVLSTVRGVGYRFQ